MVLLNKLFLLNSHVYCWIVWLKSLCIRKSWQWNYILIQMFTEYFNAVLNYCIWLFYLKSKSNIFLKRIELCCLCKLFRSVIFSMLSCYMYHCFNVQYFNVNFLMYSHNKENASIMNFLFFFFGGGGDFFFQTVFKY